MKKLLVTSLFILILCFSSCSAMPFRPQQLEIAQQQIHTIYVSGAVENEGFYCFPEGSEWLDCVEAAGYIPQTVMPDTPHGVISADGMLILRYYDGKNYCDCINLNGGYVSERRQIENVSEDVVAKIADFLDENGKITDRTQLKGVLGDDYADNFYKFYVDKNDYKKIASEAAL